MVLLPFMRLGSRLGSCTQKPRLVSISLRALLFKYALGAKDAQPDNNAANTGIPMRRAVNLVNMSELLPSMSLDIIIHAPQCMR
jgi:hypothetical protein